MREIAADLLCDIVAEAGFEAFETIENGVNGYIQSTLYHQESLDLALQDWPLDDISVSYSISEAGKIRASSPSSSMMLSWSMMQKGHIRPISFPLTDIRLA